MTTETRPVGLTLRCSETGSRALVAIDAPQAGSLSLSR